MAYLFDYHISYQSDCNNVTTLPFQLFGMSQQGSSHQNMSIGNQDAASVFVGKNLLIGVVADGCSSGKNINGFSSNQVGANIACNLTVKITRRLFQRKKLSIERFKREFEISLFQQYHRLFNAFSPWKRERNILLSNMLSSTFVLFIVTKSHYLLLHCGDGDAFINKQHYDLSFKEGEYFSNRLITQWSKEKIKNHNNWNYIKFIKVDSVANLENILISTDGFVNSQIENNKEFHKFFFKSKPIFHQVGFVDRKAEFRSNVLANILKNQSLADWPYDDAAFISLKRVPKFKIK